MRRAVAAAALAACAVIRAAVPAAAQMESFSDEEIQAARQDPDKYTIDEGSLAIENLGPTVNPRGGGPLLPPPPTPPAPGGGLRPVLGDISEIIRVGREIWSIVEANRPQVDVSNEYWSAVPRGLESWTDLEGWDAPKGTTYRLTAKNLYGMTMVDVTFSVLRRTGGSYRDASDRVRGEFLTGVTVEPLSVTVGPGYRLDLTAHMDPQSIGNVGTRENPIASMTPRVSWRIRTVIKDSQGRSLYYLTGDGQFRELAGPFRRDSLGPVAQSLDKELEFDR
ncbi:MAG: hypothetical protein SF051_10530 [Elusimicrobiota bacterium]|nr:hypothetical protein [Elusimicrobiota bacterium]